jgi:hypothetical protein
MILVLTISIVLLMMMSRSTPSKLTCRKNIDAYVVVKVGILFGVACLVDDLFEAVAGEARRFFVCCHCCFDYSVCLLTL